MVTAFIINIMYNQMYANLYVKTNNGFEMLIIVLYLLL